MSFVRKNTPIEDCGFFSDAAKGLKNAASKGFNKAKNGVEKAKNSAKKGLKKLKKELETVSVDDVLNLERDVQLLENGKQFVPPNKL